jgi:UDP-3-O-[3-hydroxymyristoyl] glucosamine N-acyltransferase
VTAEFRPRSGEAGDVPSTPTWDGVIGLPGETLRALASRFGGRVLAGGDEIPVRIVPVAGAGPGDLAPLTASRYLRAGIAAASRGAALLVDESMASVVREVPAAWAHARATWAMAELLETLHVPDVPPRVGEGCIIAPTAVLGPRVVVGDRVTIGPGAVIGHPGFGWARGEGLAVRAIPQLGGVVIEDDVFIGPLCTVDAGTLSPTRVRRGAKIDAQVHVGHNADIGEAAVIAAQSGFAGSVKIGRGALIGGQVGIADHVTVGEGARVAAKSGVIGDVPAGTVVAGYPAVARVRWLRALARAFRGL